jgi:hypothetical protein
VPVQVVETLTPDSGARGCHAHDQIDQLCFRRGLQQNGQWIILFAFYRHDELLLGKLKLHDLAQ